MIEKIGHKSWNKPKLGEVGADKAEESSIIARDDSTKTGIFPKWLYSICDKNV